MTVLMVIAILLLVVLVILIGYLCYRLRVKKEDEKVSLVQNLFEIMGSNLSTDDKIKRLNSAILKEYQVDYSSVVLFDGRKNNVKATNVSEPFVSSITEIANDYIFKGNISKKTAKYVTTDYKSTLLYTSAIERKIRSALFIPLYHEDSYLGYVFLEDEMPNKFEDIGKSEIDTLKSNVSILLENVNYQSTIEIAETIDKQTSFYNNMYLYSHARNILNSYDNSTVAIVYLKSLPDVNEKYSRTIGNTLLVKFANITKEVCPKNTIYIRYSGLRFLILIPGFTKEKSQPIFERLLSRYKSECEFFEDTKVTLDTQVLVSTFKRPGNIEAEVQKMSSSFDRIKDVNVIKLV